MPQAWIVTQKSQTSHGAARHIDRLFIPSEQLIITPHRDKATEVSIDEEVRNAVVRSEIEVSDELVLVAWAIIANAKELDRLIIEGPPELKDLKRQLM